jgi:NAD(P)H dehydrogenase (quinone)
LLNVTLPRPRVAILGGGPGGYEAALVASQLGAEATVVDEDGLGGACVLTDCVPSKTLIESSSTMTSLARSATLRIDLPHAANTQLWVNAPPH